MKYYTTAELARAFGVTRQRICNMRRDGLLKQGEHWVWREGTLLHTEAAYKLIESRRNAAT